MEKTGDQALSKKKGRVVPTIMSDTVREYVIPNYGLVLGRYVFYTKLF